MRPWIGVKLGVCRVCVNTAVNEDVHHGRRVPEVAIATPRQGLRGFDQEHAHLLSHLKNCLR